LIVSFVMSKYTNVYPAPSTIPVRVLMCDSAEYKRYTERQGSTFDTDYLAYNGGELGGHLPEYARKITSIHFIYADGKSAVVIYYDLEEKKWKLITHDRTAGANKYNIYVSTHKCVPNDDQTERNEMPHVNFASQVFNLESGQWIYQQTAQEARQEQTSAKLFQIRLKI